MNREWGHGLYSLSLAFENFSKKVIGFFISSCLAVIFLSIFALIFMRYVLNFSIPGMYEVTVILFVYLSTFALVYCFIEHEHIAVTVLFDHLNRKQQRFMSLVNYTIIFLLNLLFFWGCIEWIQRTGAYKAQISGIPQFFSQITIPISSAWVMIVSFLRVLCLLFHPQGMDLSIGGSEDHVEEFVAHQEVSI